MKKVLVVFLLCVVLITVVVAQTTPVAKFGTFKQGTDIDLIQSCSNSSSLCDGCNISTVQYPNSTTLISDKAMTKRSGDFNHTLLGENETRTVGDYLVSGFCFTGSETEVWIYDFTITFSGEELSTAGGLVSIIFLIGSLFIFSIVLWGAIVIPFGHNTDPEQNIISVNDLRFVKIFFIAISYVLLMFIFGVLKRITESFLVLEGASKLFNWLFQIMFAFLWPLIVLTFIFTFIIWLNNLTIKKKLRRGLRVKS